MVRLTLLTVLYAAASALALPTSTTTDLIVPDFVLSPEHALNRRQSINYNQQYTTGGSIQYSHSGSSYSAIWNNANDFVVGIGWNPGNSNPIKYSGSFSSYSGSGRLTVYGWTTNPLIEYYIIENYASAPGSGTNKGTVSSDGGSYTIWQNTRTNAPSIQGTSTFQQFINVRSSKRSSGTVTVANHFNAWAAKGMKLGTHNFQVLAVEAWSGSGSAQMTVSK